MARSEAVVRIVVNGCPWKDLDRTNFAKAREMLSQALESDGWPSERCMFAITPGGFIHAHMPTTNRETGGWSTCPEDFQDLIPAAQDAIDQVVTTKMKRELALRARFLTLGIDLGHHPGTHAEMVAVIDLSTGMSCTWTGKSYPTGRQEKTLVHETDLTSHCWLSKPRTLILGCHDLNAFSHRAQAVAKRAARVARWKALDALARTLKPVVVLHHPHQTDCEKTWQLGWSGVREDLNSVRTYASGIAYYHPSGPDREPRKPLDGVLESTKCGHVTDIHVHGHRIV